MAGFFKRIFKRSPKPVSSKRTRFHGVSRRTFLKLAAGSGVGVAFFGACNQHPVEMGSPILTRGKSLQSVIEATPDIVRLEMAWIKELGKSGEVRENVVNRKPSGTNFARITKTVRSLIHSHPIQGANPNYPLAFRLRCCSIQSPEDMDFFIDKALSAKENLRFSHTAAIDGHGKVMGYSSTFLEKRFLHSLKTDTSLLIGVADNLRHYREEFDRLSWSTKETSVEPLVSILNDYESFLGNLKQFGLRIRHTPMPGYAFKDGYFQPKP